MRQRSFWRGHALLLLLSFAVGCASVSGPEVAVAPIIAARQQTALTLEQQGQLREALNEWKVVLTIDPADKAALEGKARVENLIARNLADSLARGRDALKRGVRLEARRQFLIALALDPTNREAFEALQNEAKEVRVINHVVRSGETLSSIAAFYYGDRSRSDVIWETNQLTPNIKLVPGMSLKIPEIPGLPLGRPEPVKPAPPRRDASIPEPAKSDVPEQEDPYAHPMLMEAKDAIDRHEYSAALTTLDRFLSQNPRSTEGVELKRTALFQQGKLLSDQKKYAESFTVLNQLVKLSPKDQESTTLFTSVKNQLVQDHYNQGLRYYREEKLQAAITEWRTVLQYDSNHEGARKNIDQAERLLKGLQQRQQKKPAG